MAKLVETAVRDMWATLVGRWILGILSASVIGMASLALNAYTDFIKQEERTQIMLSSVLARLDKQEGKQDAMAAKIEEMRVDAAAARILGGPRSPLR